MNSGVVAGVGKADTAEDPGTGVPVLLLVADADDPNDDCPTL